VSILSEFKAFVLRGNVVDLAVGVIIGTAFGGIVTSLVEDIMTPPIGWVMDGVDFTGLAAKLPPKKELLEGKLPDLAAKEEPKPAEKKDGEKKDEKAAPAPPPVASAPAAPAKDEPKPVLIKYGNFIQKIINFTITAFCLFMVVKMMNKLKKKEADKPADPSPSEKLLAEIRDELRKK
jgi:large conductance mechanosensitive channel